MVFFVPNKINEEINREEEERNKKNKSEYIFCFRFWNSHQKVKKIQTYITMPPITEIKVQKV